MTHRLFIAVDLTADIKDVLRGVQARPQCQGLRVRWTSPEQMHLTLVFLGATDEREVTPVGQAMSAAVAAHRPLRLSLGGLGAFPDLARPKVVWCGVNGDTDQLAHLRTAIRGAIGAVVAPADDGPYTPHLTIGRVRRDAQAAERRMVGNTLEHAEALPRLSWSVDQVVLYESVPSASGVRHVPLLSAPLQAAVSV
jgi:2'-5' RNA ligase